MSFAGEHHIERPPVIRDLQLTKSTNEGEAAGGGRRREGSGAFFMCVIVSLGFITLNPAMGCRSGHISVYNMHSESVCGGIVSKRRLWAIRFSVVRAPLNDKVVSVPLR